jgi:tetratricopeptide (TPR) repeat protein
MEMKDYEKAIPLLTEGVAMVHNLRLRSYEWEAMKNLAFCYSATGNHKLAAMLYPKALEIKDSIYRDESYRANCPNGSALPNPKGWKSEAFGARSGD